MNHPLLLLCLLFVACSQQSHTPSVIFGSVTDRPDTVSVYDLPQIQEAGTLIGVTLSGPDTYFEYRGQGMGIQFRMAEEFAGQAGVALQMEIAPDTATLLQMLNEGQADFVCMEMKKGEPWLTRDDTPLLTEAIRHWWDPLRSQRIAEQQRKRSEPRRRSLPVMKDRQHGIISPYDQLFRLHSRTAGWDWRLLASQCWQESGFDPKAVSWAGAQGLMQLMPATAESLGVKGDAVFNPEENIAAAARYIRQLDASFRDVTDPAERIAFVLAAYNGGAHHVRDAMTLTRNSGGDEYSWQQVSTYILRLSEPRYYRDPSVKYGYMRGSETEAYVRNILERWEGYRRTAPLKHSSKK